MNKDHLAGNLKKMLIGPQIQEVSHSTLMIKPTYAQKGAKPAPPQKKKEGTESDL